VVALFGALRSLPAFLILVYQYAVKVKLARPSSAKDQAGKVVLTIHSKNEPIQIQLAMGMLSHPSHICHLFHCFVFICSNMDLVHGSEKNFLVTSKLDFGEVRGVTLTWTKSSSVLNPLNWFRGNEIHVESLSSESYVPVFKEGFTEIHVPKQRGYCY